MTKARNIANIASDGSALADGTINYTDVSGTPTLATVATSGSFNDLSNQPAAFDPNTLAPVAVSGAYADVTGTPTLATVATTGAYADVTGTPAAALPLTGGTVSGNVTLNGALNGVTSVDATTVAALTAAGVGVTPASELISNIPVADPAVGLTLFNSELYGAFYKEDKSSFSIYKTSNLTTWSHVLTQSLSSYANPSFTGFDATANHICLGIKQGTNTADTRSVFFHSADGSTFTATVSPVSSGSEVYNIMFPKWNGTYYYHYDELTNIATTNFRRSTNLSSWSTMLAATATTSRAAYMKAVIGHNGIGWALIGNYASSRTYYRTTNYGTSWATFSTPSAPYTLNAVVSDFVVSAGAYYDDSGLRETNTDYLVSSGGNYTPTLSGALLYNNTGSDGTAAAAVSNFPANVSSSSYILSIKRWNPLAGISQNNELYVADTFNGTYIKTVPPKNLVLNSTVMDYIQKFNGSYYALSNAIIATEGGAGLWKIA